MRFSPLPRLPLALLGIFLSASVFAPLPFAVLQPGGGKDVLGAVIDVQGTKTYPSTGKLLLTTVLATSPSSPIFGADILYAWMKGDSIVLPRSVVYPPEKSSEQINAANAADMKNSQQVATGAALAYLGYPVDQDRVTVSITVKNTGGPSGGVIFALGIIEKLTPEDLLAGRTVAGTGTIDKVGRIGPIGGIDEKLIAARRAGATVFLFSSENCDDIYNVPRGLTLYSVSTLREAVSVLKDASNAVPHCTWQRNQ